MTDPTPNPSVLLLGATGAVGSQVTRTLTAMPELGSITLLGRRPLEGQTDPRIRQATVDIFDESSYEGLLEHHSAAICTLGVGEPSKASRDDFVRIDRDAVLAFAGACRTARVRHFQLLGSVGANPKSWSFYLRTKGELESGLREMGFDRLSLFRPSMILTPTNRYGLSQAVALAVWPKLPPVLVGPLRKFRGIPVEQLGRAIALNLRGEGSGAEVLHWDEISRLAGTPP